MASSQDLLIALSRAYALAQTDAGEDPELLEAVGAAREIHEAVGWQVVRLEGEGYSVNGETRPAPEGEAAVFLEALAGARILELRLQEVVPPDALLDFLRRLGPGRGGEEAPGSARFRGLQGVIGLSFRPAAGPLPGMVGSVQGLFHAEGDGEVGPWEAGGGETEGAPPQEADLPPEVKELVASFLGATGPEKVRAGEALVAAGARLREARELGLLANLVETLSEASWQGDGDPAAQDLAIRLTSTGVASQLVGRLGSTRDEEERERLIRVSAGLGREMAVALADALGEARDRYQRRSFMDAMVAHGDLAREMAEGMVEDPRWYVVRNGVSLLGEIGGAGAVSHLTSTLANEDARVRKETVLALAKLGGEDAAMLLLGMLDDTDAEVRAKACAAVGMLKVERALKPLMMLLEKDSDLEVQIQSLLALGRIGDPGAVSLIERKAVGRLFSRPAKEIRMAAYRALAGMTTPHARSLLEKATKDSDPDVRKLARGLVD